MLISFIIPYHNEPMEMLRQCIGSILALPLSEEEREIIVVDDGSEASPAEALAQMDTSIVCISQENQGLSVTRNNGIALAKGEYIQFVDSDDCLLPDYERCIGYVRKKEYDVVMFRFSTVLSADREKTEKIEFEGKATDFLANHNLRGASCCYCFRKSILGNLRFMPGIYHEDELFTPQLLLNAGRIISVEIRAYFYRQHEGSIIHSRDREKSMKRLNDAEYVIMTLNGIATEQERSGNGDCSSALSRRVHQLTMDYIYNIFRETHSTGEFSKRKKRLHNAGIYPLPFKRYTLKYLLFSAMTHLT